MPVPADRPPLQNITAPLLVGRAREWALLGDHLAAARTGRGSLILIGGEPGIGKTALADAVCRDAARQGALALVGHCYDLTETPPYGPWLDLFARYPSSPDLPQLPAVFARRGMVGDVASQRGLFLQVQDLLIAAAKRHPLVLFLDDLHWADTSSLDLLRFISHSLSTLPLLLITTYRADELSSQHALYQLLPALVRESSATRLDLRRLHADDIEALVTHRYRLVAADVTPLVRYLHTRAEGNPLFTLELLRALEEEDILRRTDNSEWTLSEAIHVAVPSLLRQVIDRRVARLGEEAQALLSVAAVIGQEVPLTIWSAIAEVDEEQLLAVMERAVPAQIIAESPDGASVRFLHPLIRESLYESVLAARRRRLHRRAGEALASLPQPDPDAVAFHFRQAGDARAPDWLVRAGDRARRTYAYSIAAERYRAALTAMESDEVDARERGWLLYRLARMDWSLTPQERFARFDEAIHCALEADDRLLAAEAHYRRSLLLCDGGDLREGLTEMTAAVAALEALSPADRERLAASWETIRLPPAHGAQVAVYLSTAGRYIEARTHAERFLTDTAASAYADRLVGHMVAAYNGLAAAFAHLGHPEDARRVYMQSRDLRRTAYPGSTSGVSALLELIWVARPYYADDLAYCHRLALESEQEYVGSFQARGESPSVHPRFAHLPVLYGEGRWDEARELAMAMRAAFVSSGPTYEIPTGVLSLIAAAQGDRELAWALVHEKFPALSQVMPGDVPFDTAIVLQQVAAALTTEDGDLKEARTWLEAQDRWLAWNGAVLDRAEAQLGWARYYRAADDHSRAREHARRALRYATDPRQPLALIAAQRLLGELETDAGRFAEAGAHLEASLALADACAAPHERALTLLALAALHAATGRRTDAERLLDDVRAICTPLGARPALARADALAARLAAASKAPAAYPDDLSAREIDVLRLLASGLTNQEIADNLSVSVRTVERHITNLYGKIGARGKADATAYAIRHHLT